jgi:hypothetical protein
MNPETTTLQAPEGLILTARERWCRKSVTPVAEVDGIWLIEVQPYFATQGLGNRYLIAYRDCYDRWEGWCCSPPVMNGWVPDVNASIPESTLTLFRNILLLSQ